MNENILVLVGHSFASPDVIVVEEARQIGTYKDPDGNILGPEYDSSTESWMNRNDMNCTLYSIEKNQLETVRTSYEAWVNAAHNTSVSDDEVNRLKQAFLQYVDNL